MLPASTKTWATTLAFGVAATAASLSGSAALAACPTIAIDDILGGATIVCPFGDKEFTFNPTGGLDSTLAGGTIDISGTGADYTLLFSGFNNPIDNATVFFSYTVDVAFGPDLIEMVSSDIGTLTASGLPTTSSTLTYNLSAGPGAGITEFTHSISQTPGPLPILGAGAAFGFSRKLRSRIKKVA